MNKQRTIRLMLLGDEKVGKSSLISALVSQHASERVPKVLHDIVIPTEDSRDNVVISLHDTSSNAGDVMEVIKTMNRSDAAIVVYDVSRSISSQRLGYWLDLLKVTKAVPVILVGNKSDLLPGGSESSRVQSIMRNYKFIVHSLECSARTLTNVKKTFGLAQKAVLYPMAPLYDAEKKQLHPKFVNVLRRIFRLFDLDRDGAISRPELHEYQNLCFKTRMKPEDMEALIELVSLTKPDGVCPRTRGLLFPGFAYLSELAIEKSKPEHCWQVLRTLGYNDTLDLDIPHDHLDFGHADFDMCELSSATVAFLKAIYVQFAPLSAAAIDDIFTIVPDDKQPKWVKLPLEYTLDLAHWLSLWSLEMAIWPRRALEQLYYLGFVDTKAAAAVEIRRRQQSRTRANSNVIRCLLFGSAQSGKTAVTNTATCYSFLSPEPFEPHVTDPRPVALQAYQHLLHNVHTVVEKDGGSTDKSLIISEVSESVMDHETVLDIAKSVQVDIVCYLFDGEDTDSFEYVAKLQQDISDSVPCVYVCSTPTLLETATTSYPALDACTKHCADLMPPPPLHVCLSTKEGFDTLYNALITRALNPHGAIPFTKQKAAAKRTRHMLYAVGALVAAGVLAGVGYVYRDQVKTYTASVLRMWRDQATKLPQLKA
ncbi:Aste57867_20675 [Aphanomyces stellatus]|uniref:Mitochondrial Rho GTPase n=1 Tax=Aphanomyces stellatus TaxID=120398 RepID=A0A485LFG9_9STRA|nr:hypothetical protein As57867_020607 [Aphanomyces stellatus]VFT97355.1 Aste57867_20675 [Aphanomyces stellatus]